MIALGGACFSLRETGACRMGRRKRLLHNAAGLANHKKRWSAPRDANQPDKECPCQFSGGLP
jgi:hypothetical protein